MSTVFHLDASMRVGNSATRALSQEIVEKLGADQVLRLDLLASPVPQIDEQWIDANTTPEAERNLAQKQALQLSDRLLDDLIHSDMLVIAVPIYNFGVPAALKAWIDQVCRAGVSFQYTEKGPEGLLKEKKAILVIASGGVPVDSPVDFATPYMRQFLAFVGIDDVQVIAADAMAMNSDSLQQARDKIAALAA